MPCFADPLASGFLCPSMNDLRRALQRGVRPSEGGHLRAGFHHDSRRLPPTWPRPNCSGSAPLSRRPARSTFHVKRAGPHFPALVAGSRRRIVNHPSRAKWKPTLYPWQRGSAAHPPREMLLRSTRNSREATADWGMTRTLQSPNYPRPHWVALSRNRVSTGSNLADQGFPPVHRGFGSGW